MSVPIALGGPGDALVISGSMTSPEVFAVIFDRHFVAIHRYLARRAGRDRADDLASQTFTVAFERRASFRANAGDARPWLYGIATKLLANDRRAEQRLLNTLARITAQTSRSETATGFELEADCDVAGALSRMDAVHRDVLLLHVWGELSYEEIAASLGVPLGTVRSRLSRARASLRAELGTTLAAAPHARPENQEAS